MKIYTDWRNLPASARGASVALGNFDGVHIGHEAVLRAAHSARPDATRAVLTFDPHPREYFRPQDPPFRLTLAAERAAVLEAMEVEVLFQLPFNAELSHLSAEAFVQEVLFEGIGATHLSCGGDFAFGYRRGGDVAFLGARAEVLGIGVSVAPMVTDAQGPVSSTRIRRLLQDGYPERASLLLGRPYAIRGVVAHGDARGRTIGFPTANIPLGRHLEPQRGVYGVTAYIGGKLHKGVANIGLRPTVGGTESRLEVYFFDFAGDLYGQELAVQLRVFIRPEQKFPSFDALKTQIGRDVAHARHMLDALPNSTT